MRKLIRLRLSRTRLRATCKGMRARLTRSLATLVLLVALLAPFAGGWAMALGLAEGRILVICTGDGLRTIYVDQHGEATDLSKDAVSCVLKSAADTAQAALPNGLAERLLFIAEASVFGAVLVARDGFPAHFPRAPPMI